MACELPPQKGTFHCFHQLQNQPDITLYVVDTNPLVLEKDGYTVVMNEAGVFHYAELGANGRLVPSNIPATNPPPDSLPPALRQNPDLTLADEEERRIRAEEIEEDLKSKSKLLSPFGIFAKAEPDGLLYGPRITSGKVLCLTVLVEFQDVRFPQGAMNDFSQLFNTRGYNGNGNFGSVRDYFLHVSGDRMDVSTEVVGPLRLSRAKSHYHTEPMLREVLDWLRAQYSGTDLSRFDYGNRGLVSALNVIYAGNVIWDGWLHPHNHIINLRDHGTDGRINNSMEVYFYLLSNYGTSSRDLRIGTLCHELGHLLCRFPDIYDTGNRDNDFQESQGIGQYCLMGSGNHNDQGRFPSIPNAHYRALVGWGTQHSLNSMLGQRITLEADNLEDIYVFTIDSHESFVIENRNGKQGSLNYPLPSKGLAIYHCDTWGSNEWQNGTADKHYQVALLQADGKRDLERNKNRGDAGDMFPHGTPSYSYAIPNDK